MREDVGDGGSRRQVPSLNHPHSLWGAERHRAYVPRRARGAFTRLLLLASLVGIVSCKRKVSEKQCEELLDRFAELVVKERFPDAGAEVIAAERQRERGEAKGDQLRNCTSEVQADEHSCAMKAASSEALIKCLE